MVLVFGMMWTLSSQQEVNQNQGLLGLKRTEFNVVVGSAALIGIILLAVIAVVCRGVYVKNKNGGDREASTYL
ncbi:Hypp5270 [Branchiostoma lanceolatum]|uniref:Hypp5270 protein n=1 Tax=Branchiostoma lanceolatum TaxID=7740 RepID=A0A8K0F125_BRALA|nr:Hypp5270 [Branchiostoma lanceolatum]